MLALIHLIIFCQLAINYPSICVPSNMLKVAAQVHQIAVQFGQCWSFLPLTSYS